MKPLGWALLAAVCFAGNMLGDLDLIEKADATSWGLLGFGFTAAYAASGRRP